ncbi:hypothetical protein AGR1C_pAt40169 [Agrobacterium fabacearum TT111]|nr:hypothetical protein AGR1C_pAt40169 [Agrobacterium fabacearum TT111]
MNRLVKNKKLKLMTGFRQLNMQLIVVLPMSTLLRNAGLKRQAVRSPDRVKPTQPRGGL